MKIEIPALSLVMLVGASGSGKSTFAKAHFLPTEVLSSDHYRGVVADDESDQKASADAFEVLRFIAAKRLRAGRLTVVDATNVRKEDRAEWIGLAREQDALPVAIVFDLPSQLCLERNVDRPDRQFHESVVLKQAAALKQSLRGLRNEGFAQVHVLKSPDEVGAAAVSRRKLWNDRREEHGPFDIIGDVHGCLGELLLLLAKLGYEIASEGERWSAVPPAGRKAIFLGDLVDRGPESPGVLKLVMGMVGAGHAVCLPGNHEMKLKKKLQGRNVKPTHGLKETLAQLENESPEFLREAAEFIDGLVSHFVLDDGRLVVAHAGLKEEFQGRASSRVRDFCLFGETTGETDEYGFPVRYDWTRDYRGRAAVVYGHTPVPEAEWTNGTICIDTGCVFGGKLTALRWPEKEIVDVAANRVYYEPVKPLAPPKEARALRPYHDILDIEDVVGRRHIETRLMRAVAVRDDNAAAALEVMSRFAIDPHWLVYLPPTMSPCETAGEGPELERPEGAFRYFKASGVSRIVCEEKHMGSRAILLVTRSPEAAAKRFGVRDGKAGVVYTRTGRAFFSRCEDEAAIVQATAAAVEKAGLWEKLASDWILLDAELMPWSTKGLELLRTQYAPTGSAARAFSAEAVRSLGACAAHNDDAKALLEKALERNRSADAFTAAYRRYSWAVNGTDGLVIAPFHVLASEGKVHIDRNHVEHMRLLATLTDADPKLFLATRYLEVDVADPESMARGVAFWEELTADGGEGMVAKPLEWVVKHPRFGLVQPAVKCRGREYLRIIYGPEYTAPENLERLRKRGLGAKRSLALRQFALGIEGLERLVRGEPLHRVHECVFAVLALESEPVDPRL